MVRAIEKPRNIADNLTKQFLWVAMLVITVVTFYQVVMRYVFKNTPPWAEEFVRFVFVWISFVGAAIGIKENIHIGIDVIVNLLPQKARLATTLIAQILVGAFASVLIYSGYGLTMSTAHQPSPALGISMSYVYAALPVGGALMLYYLVGQVLELIKKPQ